MIIKHQTVPAGYQHLPVFLLQVRLLLATLVDHFGLATMTQGLAGKGLLMTTAAAQAPTSLILLGGAAAVGAIFYLFKNMGAEEPINFSIPHAVLGAGLGVGLSLLCSPIGLGPDALVLRH